MTSYGYDGTGMRVSKSQGTNVEKFYWDRGYVANESLNGSFTVTNHIGAQGIFARTSGTNTDYLLKNGHGDVTETVRAGAATGTYDYDAYGVQKSQNANDTNPIRYSGEYLDDESGLIYLRNRYYDPAIGRFITEDPIQDGLNWYAYCGNNPVNYWDPSGNIREPGYVNGVWCENPDAYEFGKDSLVYDSLVTLGEMWEIRPDNRSDIEALANEVRSVGRQFGISSKLKIARSQAPSSANSTDIVLMAGDMDKAYWAGKDMQAATKYANELYGTDSDGSQHNALKHTMWNGLMTKRYGEDYAKKIANSHEFGAKENLNLDASQQELMNMDLFNNAIGRGLGRTFIKSHWYGDYKDELAWEIVRKINNKTIWVISWVD